MKKTKLFFRQENQFAKSIIRGYFPEKDREGQIFLDFWVITQHVLHHVFELF